MQNKIDYHHAQQRAAHVLDEANRQGLNPLGTLYEALIQAYLKQEELKRAKV